MATKAELLKAMGVRYRGAVRAERSRIWRDNLGFFRESMQTAGG